ncbi:MAG: rhomboid family intramembrane serine protease [Phycisphaerales bacterium]|nr:rhomboid family intramembrane serine protease [Phycisphaerales bacterium]
MIPLGIDRDTQKTPIATIAIVVVNIVVFLVVSLGLQSDSAGAAAIRNFGVFHPGTMTVLTHPWTLVTYAFLHDSSGLSHVAFNMLFLWIFGRAVEDRLGSLWFTLFYLAGAVAAALGQWLVDAAPMIGASGAVAATTGAFAALCPRARVRVLFFFSIIEIPGIVLVLIFAGIDLLGQIGATISSTGGIAYSAHLFGYLFGIITMVALLGLRILKRTEFDAFFLMKQWHRRRVMRDAMNHHDSPWMRDAARVTVTTEPGKPIPNAVVARAPLSDADAKRALDDATGRWSRGDSAGAASAWERFAARCPAHKEARGALLLAAVAHARRLSAPSRAREILHALMSRDPAVAGNMSEVAGRELEDDEVSAQARRLLGELDGATLA